MRSPPAERAMSRSARCNVSRTASRGKSAMPAASTARAASSESDTGTDTSTVVPTPAAVPSPLDAALPPARRRLPGREPLRLGLDPVRDAVPDHVEQGIAERRQDVRIEAHLATAEVELHAPCDALGGVADRALEGAG